MILVMKIVIMMFKRYRGKIHNLLVPMCLFQARGLLQKRKRAATTYEFAKSQAPPLKPTKTIVSMFMKTPEEVVH